MSAAELAMAWRERAGLLERHGAVEAAATCRELAAELTDALKEVADELLTLTEAATESGYSPRRLRELIAEGAIPQAGRKGAPRIRRGSLPRKATTSPDAAEAASRVLRRMRA
ncbi:MAG TPA: hypothetical protein VMM79_14385 [Longimicrobiales bacterium]|nr:hypothetical protein [Longimicrobiales bacterium]